MPTLETGSPQQTSGAPAPATPATEAPLAAEPPPSGPIVLELAAEGPCWVSLRIDGRPIYARLFQAGDRDTHRARSEVVLTVGDAGVFRYTLNGRPGRPLGRSGQVVTVRINPTNLPEYLVP